jgi:hypothetical protein
MIYRLLRWRDTAEGEQFQETIESRIGLYMSSKGSECQCSEISQMQRKQLHSGKRNGKGERLG